MRDCGVCLSRYDGESDFVKSENRKAKKNYACSECGKVIPKGSLYEYASGKSEGQFWTFRTCLICAEIAEAFYCDGRLFGGMLWEEMNDYAFENMTTGCLDRLTTAAAKEELVRRWNDWKFSK